MFIPETTASNLPSFAQFHPEQLWLEIDEDTEQKAEELAQTQIYPALGSLVYLNQVARSCFQKGLSEQIDEDMPIQIISEDNDDEQWLRRWVFINGSDLECEIATPEGTSTKRLVLIPLDPTEDSHLFSVPREWVDIEDWAADYYVSVHVSPEDSWLRVRGFKTHKQLKHEAEYNPYNFSYELPPEELMTDFSVLLLSLELTTDTHPEWQGEVSPKLNPTISEEEAASILSKWQELAPYSPRTLMDFEKWVAFIRRPEWREKLYQSRIVEPSEISSPVQEEIEDQLKATDLERLSSNSLENLRQIRQKTNSPKEALVQFLQKAKKQVEEALKNSVVQLDEEEKDDLKYDIFEDLKESLGLFNDQRFATSSSAVPGLLDMSFHDRSKKGAPDEEESLKEPEINQRELISIADQLTEDLLEIYKKSA